MNRWMLLGCLFGFIGVAMGAFGAHALSSTLDNRGLSIYQTAAQYQMYHALALLAFGLWTLHNPGTSNLPGWAFTFGILIFSGSLYALSISGAKVLGAITPIGGVAMMVGWIAFGIQVWRT